MSTFLGRGTFLTVSKVDGGKVRKSFRFELMQDTADRLENMHALYVTHLSRVINVPETGVSREKLQNGNERVHFLQEDLSDKGRLVFDVLKSDATTDQKIQAISLMFSETVKVCNFKNPNVLLGIDSSPHNWWMQEGEVPRLVFFDTTPPLISIDGTLETKVLIPKENPSVLGKVMAFLAHTWPIRPLSEIVIKNYAFDLSTGIRTLLVKTVDAVPNLKKDIIRIARDSIQSINEDQKPKFEKKLSTFSIEFELLKLRVFNWFNNL